MQCERLDICVFYKTHRYTMSPKQYELLVQSYCEGSLHRNCHRKKYREEFSKEPPDDMAPNGYQVGSHRKIF